MCTGNLDRSPTAEQIFKNWEDLEVRSAGTHWSAPTTLYWDLIDWADLIFVMEEAHKKYIVDWIPEASKKIIVLDIKNNYLKMTQS